MRHIFDRNIIFLFQFFNQVAISYHKFKSVHPIIEKDDKEKLKDIEVSTSDESEDG